MSTRIFISSPYRTLSDLRRYLAEGLILEGVVPWIAESVPSRQLGINLTNFGDDGLGISDACLCALSECDGVICILGDSLGSPIARGDRYYRAKHFELEVFSALAQQKPVLVVEFADRDLIRESAEFVTAMTQTNVVWYQASGKVDALRRAVRFASDISATENIQAAGHSASERLAWGLVRLRRTSETGHRFPFWGVDEDSAAKVNLERARELIFESRTLANGHLQFGRLWMAIQELRAQSFDEACQPGVRDIWDDLLDSWRRVASFYGVHGHIFTGALAAASGLAKLRRETGDHPLPVNAVFSAKFSIIKAYPLLQRSPAFVRLYSDVLRNAAQSDDSADSQIILGSIQLRLLNTLLAEFHFRNALKLRVQQGDVFNIAYAQLHLAQSAALFVWRRKEAAGLLADAMTELSVQGSPAERKRNLLKAAWVAGRLGRKDEQSQYLHAAKMVPGSASFLDQKTGT